MRAARALIDPTFAAPTPAQLAVHLDDYQQRLLAAADGFAVRQTRSADDS